MTRTLTLGICLCACALLTGCISGHMREADDLRASYLAGDMTAMEYLEAREEIDKREKLEMDQARAANREKTGSITLFGYTLFKDNEEPETDKPWDFDNTNFDQE